MGSRDPLLELLQLRELPSRRIVGLISGTSADGVDAVLVEVAGAGLQLQVQQLSFQTVPFCAELKQRIWALPEGRTEEICELNFLLGEAFAHAALLVVDQAGLALDEVHLIGSHGQTARHQPPGGRSGAVPSTLQLGEGAVIAELTGRPVICDFRVADVAAGGQGAPLIPLVDYLLFHQPQRVRIMLNLGGIANLTVLSPEREGLLAFDTGPANMALDAVARAASRGNESYDPHGQLAAQGTVNRQLLAELLAHPYFAAPPPKSTGREMFGRSFVYPLLDRFHDQLIDLLATLVELTVESIALALEHHILSGGVFDEMYVSGGGVHNTYLMERLAQRLAPLPLYSLARLGMDPDAKEAIGFAVLANESLFCHAGNVPQATGASGLRVLGKIALSTASRP